jgi:DmsE family decaheme c-type cytochrome
MARAVALIPVLLATFGAALWGQAAPQPTQQNTLPSKAPAYVGSDVCKTCHADIWTNFYKNPHYKSLAMGNLRPERTGCEGCHGPAQAHVAAGGGKNTIPHAFSLMPAAAAQEDCLTCHAKDLSKANIQRSEHTLNGVACTSCHSIHHSATAKFLLAKKQNETCYGCHANIRAQFEMPSHHRVNEGFMQCTDCHNPHGGFAATSGMGLRPTMLTRASDTEPPCLNCHVDKRGPFVFEHPSVRVEGCQMCHSPHGSTNAKLLTRPVVFTICLECHNGGGTGTRNQGVDLQSARHNLLDPKFQKCTTCHVRIHGSNADQFFLR